MHETVKEYYGQTLSSKDDLKTTACCPTSALPSYLQPLLKSIHPEIQDKFYGCGSPIPHALEGKTVLDLGCGTGRDVYLLSQLVGPTGRVIGLDMTDSQLDTAKKHEAFHMSQFGYEHSNVRFFHAYIEDLSEHIDDQSVDIVISNCVINLSPNKQQVFSEIFRVLKPGGELLFADIFSSRRLPEPLTKDPILVGECLGGALYIEDFRRLLRDLGCLDYRVLSNSTLTLNDPEVKEKAGMIDFYSMTIRTFRCDFEDICENYGQVAWYQGSIPHCPHEFVLDDHHTFKTGLPVPVCGNTAKMLSDTHYGPHFKIAGDMSTHYGPFDCSQSPQSEEKIIGGCC